MEKLNQSQVDNFLKCLLEIDDLNYGALHDHHVNAEELKYIKTNTKKYNEQYNALIAKVTAMAVLFCATILCSAIPFILNRFFKWTTNLNSSARSTTTIIRCILYFGGGVLLSTTFLHLLPEVKEVIESLQHCGTLPDLTFALAEMLMCLGFFLMYFIEEVIHRYLHRVVSDCNETAGAAFERGYSIRNSCLMKNVQTTDNENDDDNDKDTAEVLKRVSIQGQESIKYQKSSDDSHISNSPKLKNKEQNNFYNDHKHDLQVSGHAHIHPITENEANVETMVSSLRGLLIVLALSLHELFEGMAIGLEFSASTVWFMFGAVSAHKLILAFCVGVELIVARTRTALIIIYIFTFAVVSPIGIGIGILITHDETGYQSPTPGIPSAILQGLACGTLLYVVFFEIFSKNHAGLLTYFAVLIGFGVMFGIQQLGVAGQHGHSHAVCGDTHSHEHFNIAGGGSSHEYGHDGRFFDDQLKILRKASSRLKN